MFPSMGGAKAWFHRILRRLRFGGLARAGGSLLGALTVDEPVLRVSENSGGVIEEAFLEADKIPGRTGLEIEKRRARVFCGAGGATGPSVGVGSLEGACVLSLLFNFNVLGVDCFLGNACNVFLQFG